jgi:murein DD-endopeptidase MepM/ murein hydrolase activator NlpD
MKDIIATQHIQRRAKPSLLSTAMQYHKGPEKSFINNRHLPKRKKKSLFRQNPPSVLIEQKPQGKSIAVLLAAKLEGMPRKRFLAFLRGSFAFLGLGGLVLILYLNYIPAPEPPEDASVREIMPDHAVFAGGEGDIIPLDLTETFAWQEYTVRSGDSVEGIARRFGLSLDAVIASNELRNVRRELKAGQKIRIPNMDGIPYTVKSGDSYAKIASSYDIPLEAILDANDIQSDAINAGTVLFIPGARMNKIELRQALGELFVYPLSGRRTSSFGWRTDPFSGVRSFHAGLDLAAPSGTSVKASADGRVSATGTNAVYGNFIIISHSGDYQTMYAHLSRILVRNGASVNQGTVIGRVGSTGRSTGPHLHFAVYKNKRAINPLEVLNK